ncbi:MAG: RNA pyrophosphohydrolase [Desulfobacteraceae bacterium]|nr:RNA pyrophosphohydrolase [Desulfobacteraceae bacterium]
MHQSQFFRAGAGAVIIDRQGLVLALERADTPGAWQLPQGGLDPGEEPLAAGLREAEEETGLPAAGLALLDAYPEPLVYELPPKFHSGKTGRGQVQYWFLFRYSGVSTTIDVAPGGEFRAWQWLPFEELLVLTAAFRRPLYRRLAARFREHLAGSRSA